MMVFFCKNVFEKMYKKIALPALLILTGINVCFAQQIGSSGGNGIQQPVVKVHVILDMHQAFFNGQRPDSVVILRGQLTRSVNPNPNFGLEMQNNGNNIWQANMDFTYGLASDLPFAFAWHIISGWYRETLQGNRTHLVWLGSNKSELWVRMHYDPKMARVLPDSGNDGMVDQYGAIIVKIGGQPNKKAYYYDAAMQYLEAGDLSDANKQYALFREENTKAVWDAYPEQVANKLAKQGRLTEALTLCDTHIKSDSLTEHKARLLYTEGTLLDEAGQHSQARMIYKHALRRYPDQKNVIKDIRYSLGLSYLNEKHADTVRHGISILQNLFNQATQARWKRRILHDMIRGYQAISDTSGIHKAGQMLTQVGNPSQRLMSGLELLEQDLKNLTYRQAVRRFWELVHSGQAREDSTQKKQTQIDPEQYSAVQGQMVATDSEKVGGNSGSDISGTKIQNSVQPPNTRIIISNVSGFLQAEAAWIHWEITCKRADRPKIYAEGNQYLKNYPDSPYAVWIGNRLAYMKAQEQGGKK